MPLEFRKILISIGAMVVKNPDRHTDRQTYTHTYIHTYRQTERQTDRQTDGTKILYKMITKRVMQDVLHYFFLIQIEIATLVKKKENLFGNDK